MVCVCMCVQREAKLSKGENSVKFFGNNEWYNH